MRKFAASILLVLYSVANIGLAARLDFCGEELHGIALYAQENEISDCCLEENGIDDDCCSAKIIVLQESSDKIQKSDPGRYFAATHAIVPGYSSVVELSNPGFQQPYQHPDVQKDVQRRTHLLNACFRI